MFICFDSGSVVVSSGGDGVSGGGGGVVIIVVVAAVTVLGLVIIPCNRNNVIKSNLK